MKKFVRTLQKHFPGLIALGLLLLISLSCGLIKSDEEWKSELGGKKLTTAKTSGSISDKVEIWFCASGEYAKRTEFTGVSGDFTLADADVQQGYWKVDRGVLILDPVRGETSRYDLSAGLDSNVISLNGKGYLLEKHDECVR